MHSFGSALGLLLFLTGCTGSGSSAGPGIQPREAEILTQNYYWDKARGPHQFTDAQIKALFGRAPAMLYTNGERSEIYISELAWALAAAGDRRYAALLGREPVRVQSKVLHFIKHFSTGCGLSYPRTWSLPGSQFLEEEKKAEQKEGELKDQGTQNAEASLPSDGASS
ncbi:MAG: hypothetical protein V4726_00455 [Verrucomicrobiota bacterium]